jgi:lipoprotein-anchoring transpeptidase ErfK/SrfK
VHDFGDGKGPVSGAYGPWFIRLETGWKGIGIHGTHDPGSTGTRASEGCIRMKNDDLLRIVDETSPGTVVVIKP